MPSAPPANVQLLAVGVSTITLKWDPIPQSSQNARVVGYHVKYQQTFSNRSNGEIKIMSMMGLFTKANLSELEMASIYKIEVAGETTVGTGAYSEPVTAMTCTFKTA